MGEASHELWVLFSATWRRHIMTTMLKQRMIKIVFNNFVFLLHIAELFFSLVFFCSSLPLHGRTWVLRIVNCVWGDLKVFNHTLKSDWDYLGPALTRAPDTTHDISLFQLVRSHWRVWLCVNNFAKNMIKRDNTARSPPSSSSTRSGENPHHKSFI